MTNTKTELPMALEAVLPEEVQLTAIRLTEDDITTVVFEAVQEDKYLELGQESCLEYLSYDQDGIFTTPQSWKTFLYRNFGTGDGGGSLYLTGIPSENLIKRRCYNPSEYIDRFVVRVGSDLYVRVPADLIKLSYNYDCNIFHRDSPFPSHKSYIPTALEIYVKAELK